MVIPRGDKLETKAIKTNQYSPATNADITLKHVRVPAGNKLSGGGEDTKAIPRNIAYYSSNQDMKIKKHN